MEPIEMPESWHNQFVGIQLYTGHSFRISKAALTDSIMQVANYAIDIDDGIVLKNRYGSTGVFDEEKRCLAKKWPVLHDHRNCISAWNALERRGALDRAQSRWWSAPSDVDAWEPEVICAPVSTPRFYGYGDLTTPTSTTCVQLTGTDGIS